jgi:hypothetical protein
MYDLIVCHLCYLNFKGFLYKIVQNSTDILLEMYGDDKQEGVPATFQIIYFIGWKPDPSQVRLFVSTLSVDNHLLLVSKISGDISKLCLVAILLNILKK